MFKWFRKKRTRATVDELLNGWMCHVCKEVRPDSKIDVFSKHANIDGIIMQINIRFCVDREMCIDGAPKLAEEWTPAPRLKHI